MTDIAEKKELNLLVASGIFCAAVGAAYVFSLLRIFYNASWFFYAYEPLAALAGAFGVWYYGRSESARNGFLGAGAALLAILLVEFLDLFLLRSGLWSGSFLSDAAERFSTANWLKWVKIFFGMYIGWYVGYKGRHAVTLEG